MERRTPAILTIAALCILQASRAHGGAVATSQGSYARFEGEKTLVVWDAANKTEHLVTAMTLKGDADSFGVLIATPTVPTIAKETDELIDHVGKLFTPTQTGAGVAVQARSQIGEFEAVTLQALDEKALGDWLAKSHFLDKPALRAWAKASADKGFVTAVRCTTKGTGDRKLEVRTLRLSFKTETPILPYAEATVDAADQAAYTAKYNTQPQQYRGIAYGTHPLDVYLVADRQMQTVVGQTTNGPPVSDALRVSSDALATTLGDTKAWRFDPKSLPTWVVTHLAENTWQRNTQSDLSFAPYDLPKPRPGPGITEADDRPNGPTYPASSMAWMGDPSGGKRSPPSPPHKKLFRYGAIALFFLIAGAAGYAVMSEQQREPKPKS